MRKYRKLLLVEFQASDPDTAAAAHREAISDMMSSLTTNPLVKNPGIMGRNAQEGERL